MARRRDGGYRPDGIDDSFTDAQPGGADPRDGASGQVAAPQIGAVGLLRFAWRQLTSMRVALMLLTLLAVAAVPGSVFPQQSQSPADVAQLIADHPTAGEWLERLGFFDVYASVWFSAVYILLFVSLVGCILPRTAAHLRALRSAPPRTPRRFARFPVVDGWTTDAASPDEIVDVAARTLRGRVPGLPRFRVVTGTEADGARTVSAERGYLRESGNLLFHMSLLGLLVSFGTGQLLEYRGQAIVTEGRGFANAVVDYDTFESGALFDDGALEPFSMTLDRFESEFRVSDAKAQDFAAYVTVRGSDGSTRQETIKVNHPLSEAGAKVYLQGNGFAPDVTVRDAAGEIAFSGPVPFLPEDDVYTSQGVIKVPDVSTGEQIGLVGYFLPTAEVSDGGARSVFPQPFNPLLVLTVYSGDLGLDDGVPQNVYRLETDGMTQAVEEDGSPVTLLVAPGETVDLPDDLGTLEFSALPRFVALDLRHDPTLVWVLVFALGALLGVSVSLFTPRRRVWVRARTDSADDGATPRTVVEVAGLARGDDSGLQGEVDALVAALPGAPAHDAPPEPPEDESEGTPPHDPTQDHPGPSTGKADR
ncbi:cytochrome c biogenesis protein ResB [Sanguibacter suaedae]|uniref:Cytochrome c biogenesis protein ResB n=1 Tax=Sanguibacter suaedae TaxID=2795737 RepID=A0A934I9R3_9MICO|nr:cytochrome c biogenesis protein ResB [Sanguibacter suaedae]MBI9113946.1 cytochrome c biogenesis protein ResB [Sanguibacter suaedae]